MDLPITDILSAGSTAVPCHFANACNEWIAAGRPISRSSLECNNTASIRRAA